jgi:hypothetical protein
MSDSIMIEQNISSSVADLLETAKQLQSIEQIQDFSNIISSDPKFVKSHFQLIREPDRRGQARYKCLTCSHEFECSGRGRLYQHILGRSWDTVRKNAKSCPSPYEPLRLNLVEFVKNQAVERESKKRQLETLTTDSLSTLSGDSSETISAHHLQPTIEPDSYHYSQDEDQTSKDGNDDEGSSPSLLHTKQKRPRIEVKTESSAFHQVSPSPRSSAPSSSSASSSSATPASVQEFVSSLLKEDPEDIADIMMLYHFMKQIKARKQLQEFRKRQAMQLQLQQMQQMMLFQFQQTQVLQQQQVTTKQHQFQNSFLTMKNMLSSSSPSSSPPQQLNIVPTVFSSSSGSNPSSPRATSNMGAMNLKFPVLGSMSTLKSSSELSSSSSSSSSSASSLKLAESML